MIINSLPPLPKSHSIEFFRASYDPPVPPIGWSVTSLQTTSSVLLEKDAALPIDPSLDSIIVSIKSPDKTGQAMAPINPFKSLASPPRILAWTPSSA